MTNTSFQNFVKLQLLLNTEGIGPVKILSLLNKFKNFETIFKQDVNSLNKTDGIYNNLALRLVNSFNQTDYYTEWCEKELENLTKLNGKIFTFWDEEYPENLRNIYMPPLVLYVLGDSTKAQDYSIAIVGTRTASNYGKEQAERFAKELAEKGIIIVSGLARGIDSIAHKAALDAGGKTIAVIGCGLDVIYPPENKNLYKRIAEEGIIYSEFPLGTKPDAPNFPKRNRIISGLSLGTLLVETRINGGAMQTATYALDQNREIFALPGNVDSERSEGTNLLIQKSEAKLVINPEDILTELGLKIKPIIGKNIPAPSVDLSLFEEKIFELLDENPKHIDDIADKSGMSTSDCLVNLLSLEFKGLIKQLPGKMFVR